MTHVEVHSSGGKLWVRGSGDRRLSVFATVLGAERVGESWVFEPKYERAIREFCRKINGGMPVAQPPLEPAVEPTPVPASPLHLAQSLTAMLDPALPVWQQLRHAHEVCGMLGATSADAATLEEASAAFESLAGRLRDLAERFAASS